MELRHLRYFIAVVEEASITRAAARLHISQPPLSRQIRGLEHELGVRLIERDIKPVRLTLAGEAFFAAAKVALGHVDNAVKVARAVAKGSHAKIHIGHSPSLAVELLPRILRVFQEQLPQARVKLHELSNKEMLDWLEAKKLDVALRIRLDAKLGKDLVFEELWRYGICVAMSPTHPLANVRKVGIRQLLQERLIGYVRQNYPEYYDMIDHLFTPYGSTPPIVAEHDGVASLVTAVELGQGVAIMPESLAVLAGPRLRVIPLCPAPPKLVVGITYRTGKLTPLQEQLIRASKQAVQSKS